MEAAAKFKEMALASKDAMEEFNDFAEDRATSWAFDEIRRLTALCEEQGKQIAFDCSSHQCDRIYDLASPHIEACLKAESALSQAREEVAAKQWVVDVLAEDLKGWKARAEAAEQREKVLQELLEESKQFCLKIDCDGDNLNIELARRIHAVLAAERVTK